MPKNIRHPARPPRTDKRYTPKRAQRLASQARSLWANMKSIVAEMQQLANEHEPDALSQQRMELRTVEIILTGYTGASAVGRAMASRNGS